MRGHGAPVDAPQRGEHAQQSKGSDGDDHPEHQRRNERPGDLARRGLPKRYAALDADGKEQVHRRGLIDRVGQAEVGAQGHGHQAEDEGKDGW